MNKRALIHWLHDLPDDAEILFCGDDGEFNVEAVTHVKEWECIYLGESTEDINAAILETMAESDEDLEIEDQDRDIPTRNLEESINLDEYYAAQGATCCPIPDVKNEQHSDYTETL